MTMYCTKCGVLLSDEANFCFHCGSPVGSSSSDGRAQTIRAASEYSSDIADRVRQREKAVSIIWIVIGAVQLFFGVAAIAGIWNIINAILCLLNTSTILPGNAAVVDYFKSRLVPLIIAAIINLIIGGVIGVFLAGYELYIRKIVLDNKCVFESGSSG